MGRFSKHKKKEATEIPTSPKTATEGANTHPPGLQPSGSPHDLYEGPRATKESQDKISRLQKETDEVTNVMKGNVDSMLTRGESMRDLSKQTEDLQTSSQVFASKASSVKRKLWWKNVRTTAIIIAVILTIIIVFVGFNVLTRR
jgi:hypothetical protein